MLPDYHTLACGLVTFGDDGQILIVNETLCALLGYKQEELLGGQHVQMLFPPASCVLYQTHLFPMLKLQGEVEEIYLSLRTKCGEDVPFLLNGRRRQRETGFQSECILMRMRQRSHFESELLQAKKAAEKASRAKDEFLAALSHELRTPLNPVLMMASAMEMDGDMPAEARAQAGIIRRNAELEARLIDDLLDHTRIAHGKLNLVMAPVDLHALLTNSADIVLSEDIAKRVEVTFHYQAKAFHIQGDAARLQQVFWNVIKNGIKFTPADGEVRVTTMNDKEGRLIVCVRDTGVGITPEHLKQIFKPFEQGTVSTRKYGGLGLGLAITRGIVERHGGTIWAESDGIGHGATIGVAFETVPAPAQEASLLMPSHPAKSTQLRLLLVEDHPSTRDVLAHILRRVGHEVHVAGTGAEALDVLRSAGRLDVLLSDLGLPDQSGFDVLKAVRVLQPDIAAVALSGYGMEEDLQRAKAAGFTGYFVKPVPLDQLCALLDKISAQRPSFHGREKS